MTKLTALAAAFAAGMTTFAAHSQEAPGNFGEEARKAMTDTAVADVPERTRAMNAPAKPVITSSSREGSGMFHLMTPATDAPAETASVEAGDEAASVENAKDDKAERAEKPAKAEGKEKQKTAKAAPAAEAKAAHAAKAEKASKVAKAEKAANAAKPGRAEKTAKAEKATEAKATQAAAEKASKATDGEKTAKAAEAGKAEKAATAQTEKSEKAAEAEKVTKAEKAKDVEKAEKPRKSPTLIANARKKEVLEKVTEETVTTASVASGDKFGAIVSRYAAAYGIPASLAHAVIRVESNYRVDARGSAGEVGLMQIKPATARGIGYSGSVKALYNPETNIRYGMKYLAKAHELGGGTTCGTILKYNAGHGAKRMNPVSAAYCEKVKRHLAGS